VITDQERTNTLCDEFVILATTELSKYAKAEDGCAVVAAAFAVAIRTIDSDIGPELQFSRGVIGTIKSLLRK
jgi:hypothetical protein